MTAPLAPLFPVTVLTVSRCCPPAADSALQARFFFPPTVPSCAPLLWEKSRRCFLFTDWLTDWLLLCRTKWQRKKSADLTTVLHSGARAGLGIYKPTVLCSSTAPFLFISSGGKTLLYFTLLCWFHVRRYDLILFFVLVHSEHLISEPQYLIWTLCTCIVLLKLS